MTVHYAQINFYNALVSGIGYLLWVIVQYSMENDDILQRFTLNNICLLMVASVSDVGALVFWTLAFQNAKAGKIGIVQYS